ncbi:hypothetical protein [Candidatus Chlamydia corallus]|uniref:hypothetical protein n=1 Tax=Candidatus Chlamydia corallus TaxID=2038470 RepID=UPI000C2FB96A|nr:hypothetical protein [Candidatus Chlamydia corallus]
MKKQGKILFLFLFLSFLFARPFSFLFASQINSLRTIQENIFLAKPGDYTVLSRGSQRTFILIKLMTSETVWMEIIHFPCIAYKERSSLEQASWKTLIHQLKSPSKVFVVSVSSQGSRCFSLNTEKKKLEPLLNSDAVPFLFRIFDLPLAPAPRNLIKSKEKGATPWSPKVSFEGAPLTPVSTNAWHGLWPKDRSPLSETGILMYFTEPNISVFPLWVSIDTPKGTSVVRAVDIGHGATSPYLYSLPDSKTE